MKNILFQYLPEGSCDDIFSYLQANKVHLKITSRRSSKLGDYRPPADFPNHRISVNGSLNPYAFLITLVHEMAHLEVWKKDKLKSPPHGILWKTTFIELMLPFVEKNIFPDDLQNVVIHHLKNPKASSSSDPKLATALRRYDSGVSANLPVLKDIPDDALFAINRRVFKKIEKQRSSYLCECLNNRRKYVVKEIAEVRIVERVGNKFVLKQ